MLFDLVCPTNTQKLTKERWHAYTHTQQSIDRYLSDKPHSLEAWLSFSLFILYAMNGEAMPGRMRNPHNIRLHSFKTSHNFWQVCFWVLLGDEREELEREMKQKIGMEETQYERPRTTLVEYYFMFV